MELRQIERDHPGPPGWLRGFTQHLAASLSSAARMRASRLRALYHTGRGDRGAVRLGTQRGIRYSLVMRCHAHSLVLLAGLLRPSLGRAATVNVPGDYPTIQDAVLNAPDGSAIQIAPGRYPGQVRLENGTKS